MADLIFSEIAGEQGHIGEIILNRSAALNALTDDMLLALSKQLADWSMLATIKAVVIRSACSKAFCAGGDIRQIYHHGQQHPDLARQYFAKEYQLNLQIARYPKPYIALLNGITMGGGAGISIHGSYRIASADLRFAMPEVGIGFFPDVGASYFLSRCQEPIGLYLGLTGISISAADALYAKLVDMVITAEQQSKVIELLSALPQITPALLRAQLSDLSQINTESDLQKNSALIAQHFTKNSISDIITSLQQDNHPWAQQTYSLLLRRSPTSLRVTFEQLKRAKTLALTDCLKMDFYLAQQFINEPDFYEGIRAAIIEKDQHPHWQPAQVKDISDTMLNNFFQADNKLALITADLKQ